MINHIETKKIPRGLYIYNNILLLYTICFFISCVIFSYSHQIDGNFTCFETSKKLSLYAVKFDKINLCNADAIVSFNRRLVVFGVIVSFIFILSLNILLKFTVSRFEKNFFDHLNPLNWKRQKFISVAFLTVVLIFIYIQYSFKRFYIFKSQGQQKSIEVIIFDESVSFVIFFSFFFAIYFLILFGRTRTQDGS